MGYFGSVRTGIELLRSAAQSFADRLNGVLNSTVSDARLSLIPVSSDPSAFQLSRVVAGRRAPLELHGTTMRLFVGHVIVVEDGRCRTESYGYRLQTGELAASWLMRWEYLRKAPTPGYHYPLAHLHVNASLASTETALPKLHVPTGRVPLELVLWHLIAEWGVKPKQPDWQPILEESIDKFEAMRSAP